MELLKLSSDVNECKPLMPGNTITVTLSTTSSNQIRIDPFMVYFTAANWNQPQVGQCRLILSNPC
jgi:hypothetical protein